MQKRFHEAVGSPRRVYGCPSDVLADEALSVAEKREVLLQWESEAIHLQESDAEGFGGGERSQLDEIVNALAKLSQGRDDSSTG
ncbi:MAG: hypothetical protein ABQ298_07655 [Puniceicoccaceae bacterium]